LSERSADLGHRCSSFPSPVYSSISTRCWPLTSILHVFSNAAKLVLFGRHVQWRLLLLLGIPSVVCVIMGAFLSTKLRFKYTELILGLFLIGFSVLFYCKPLIKLRPDRLNAVSAGE
jgi:uncharacterized membrane protein YfcA